MLLLYALSLLDLLLRRMRHLHVLRKEPRELVVLRLVHLGGAVTGDVGARRADAALDVLDVSGGRGGGDGPLEAELT